MNEMYRPSFSAFWFRFLFLLYLCDVIVVKPGQLRLNGLISEMIHEMDYVGEYFMNAMIFTLSGLECEPSSIFLRMGGILFD